MKTYTFKIKVDFDKVVVAVNMQLEQFYDSVKMTNLSFLVERYPEAYITACDYYADDVFVSEDYSICKLKMLLNSHDFKAFLLDKDFIGFVGDDYFDRDFSISLEKDASKFIEDENKILEADEDKNDEILENSLSEINEEYEEVEEDEDNADVSETNKE